MVMFIDRTEELRLLQEIAASPKAELVILYGRRRVGKSRLLVEFARKTNALYLLADLSENILEILARQVEEKFVRFTTWDDFFEYVLKTEREVVIIDEFQYLCQVDRAWPTILQRWWEKLKETKKKVILCGSMISAVYKISLGYGSALYGRKSREIQITPLEFRHITEFFPGYAFKQLIEAYSVLGGVPRYLEEFSDAVSIEENILRKVLDRTAFLYNEPLNLLFEEFRSPAPYTSILLALTQGHVKFAEIADASKIHATRLPKYLLVLERTGIIEKEMPVTETKLRSKTTRYKVKDPFYAFWFRFIFKEKSLIERGMQQEVSKNIAKDFNAFVGKSFESICAGLLITSPIIPLTRIGRWWHKDAEIDIVGINDATKEVIFGECKWQERVSTISLLRELVKKAPLVSWHNPQRKEHYVLFAKSFTERDVPRIKKEVGIENLHLFDLQDIEKMVAD